VADNSLPYERRGAGLLFHLRDDVKLLLKWSSSTKVTVEIWRGMDLMPPDTGNINSASFRARVAKDARLTFAKDGKDTTPNILEDLGMVALAMSSPVSGNEDGDDDESKGKSLWDLLSVTPR
jgi:hypothetical protein